MKQPGAVWMTGGGELVAVWLMEGEGRETKAVWMMGGAGARGCADDGGGGS